MPTSSLRPIERRVLTLVEAGTDKVEIARRFRRSPEFIDRVVQLASLPRHGRGRRMGGRYELRPIERRILRNVQQGETFDTMAPRFKRSAGHLERIAELAEYKLTRQA